MNEKLKALLGADYADGMTDEEGIAVLDKRESVSKAEQARLKASFDTASSDLAKFKKEHESHLTEEEKEKAASEETMKALQAENEKLKHDASVSMATARFSKMGMDDKLAKETAEAYVKGDSDKVFTNQESFLKTHDENLKKELLKNSPVPPKGGDPNHVTDKKEFKAMGYEERVKLQRDNPTLYNELSKD